MANFKTFDERETTSGPARVGLTTPVNAVADDPATFAAIMTATAYAFTAPIMDAGTTEGGVSMTHSVAAQAFTVDLSDGEFGEAITGHNYAISTSIAQTGDLTAFQLAWMAGETISAVVTSKERIIGLAAKRVFTYRSLYLVTQDIEGFLRCYYFRKVTNTAGDTAHALTGGALHLLPLNLRAFKDNTGTATLERDFGFIIEQNGFGGHVDV